MNEIELDDISKELLIINKNTIEILFQNENLNALILYMFYYKTSKWQNTSTIKANDEYCKKCLHWGIDKLQSAKRDLVKMNLIKIEKRLDDKKRIVGWYIKVNYYEKPTIPISTILEKPHVDKQETNTINNSINTINNTNTKKKNISKDILKEKYGELQNVLLTKEEYEKLKELGLINYIDKLSFYLDSTGKKYKSHYSTIRTWNNKEKETNKINSKRETIVYEMLN